MVKETLERKVFSCSPILVFSSFTPTSDTRCTRRLGRTRGAARSSMGRRRKGALGEVGRREWLHGEDSWEVERLLIRRAYKLGLGALGHYTLAPHDLKV